jgi:cytochrome c peroxidase
MSGPRPELLSPTLRRLLLAWAVLTLLPAAGAVAPETHAASRPPHHTRHRLRPFQPHAGQAPRAAATPEEEADPPEVAVGERLFLETRFAQFFAGRVGADVNRGRMASLEDAVRFYVQFSQKARRGRVRNASAEISRIFLGEAEVVPLAAFLRSLNEDYQ